MNGTATSPIPLDHTQFNLSGKVALITGGNGFLGKVFCKALATHGAHIVISDCNVDGLQECCNNLRKTDNVRAIGIPCDVADPHSVKEMVERTVSDFGKIDILHNNAAWKTDDVDAFFEPYESYSYDTWKAVLSVNLDGMFLVSQAVGNQMIRQESGGSIIQTASIYGVVGPDKRIYEGSLYQGRTINTPAAYAVSKGGVIALTKYLATTWADKNIRVNTLTPGGIENGQNKQFIDKYAEKVPMNRMGCPEDLSGVLVFLASDASNYITGQNIIVDGGFTAW